MTIDRHRAVADALEVAKRTFARGGSPSPEEDVKVAGLLHSDVAGRTDNLPISVPAGAYVLPADVVSALGEGNTMAGAKVLDEMFGPQTAAAEAYARGGHVPIVAAGGEYVVSPGTARKVGGGDLERGHEVLDRFVKHVRAKHVKTLRKLPGPKK